MNFDIRSSFDNGGPDSSCMQVAASQCGVISRTQALDAGLSTHSIQRRLKSKRWIPLLPGVYKVAGSPDLWRAHLLAVCLWMDDRGVVSHRAAGALWSFPDFAPGILEVSIKGAAHPPQNFRLGTDLVVHRVKTLPPMDIAMVDGIRLTAPHRTLLDLGAVSSEESVEQALEDALRRGLVTLARLRWTVRQNGGRGQSGSRVLRELLAARPPAARPAESSLEVAFLQLLRREKFPMPQRQFEIRDNGKLVARVDFAYPDRQLAIEVDGYRYHFGRDAWKRDRARRNQLMELGWRVVQVAKDDLESQELGTKLRRLIGSP